MSLNVFIPHRWHNNDFNSITALLDRSKYKIRDYSIPSFAPFESIDRRYILDPKIKRQIRYANVVICSNRPAIGLGMSIDEIRFAKDIGKPVVAIQVTYSTSSEISSLGIPVIPNRKDSLEKWIHDNVK